MCGFRILSEGGPWVHSERFWQQPTVVSTGLTSGNSWKTWFGLTIPASERRTIDSNTANQQEKGTYQKYTAAQEEALFRLLRWLKSNNPEVFSNDLVLGHDEVSGPKGIGHWRKNDPGGALSMTMDELRGKL